MSHQPERKEKDCLNCGAEVLGRFCHVCGQENVVTHQRFWSLVLHFIYDVLHFDGKFFHTLGYLFSRPGFVARQYAEGKRMRYLDPIRMYLFTSAIFFLLFFSFKPVDFTWDDTDRPISKAERLDLASEMEELAKNNLADSTLRRDARLLRDTARPVNADSLRANIPVLSFGNRRYTSVKEYDSVQAALPQAERDSWWEQQLTRKNIEVKKEYGGGAKAGVALLDTFLHQLPYLLFVSLPFFALILKLLYIRRKNFYYSDHTVFTLYHYIFSFILLLLVFGTAGLRTATGWQVFHYLMLLLIFSWPVYLYLEMKRFYQQGRGKTFGKFLLLNMAGFLVLLLLFMLFIVLSVFKL